MFSMNNSNYPFENKIKTRIKNQKTAKFSFIAYFYCLTYIFYLTDYQVIISILLFLLKKVNLKYIIFKKLFVTFKKHLTYYKVKSP
jgi:hypothetical protein